MSNARERTIVEKTEQIPALDGIRGYGFLAVFFAHYLELIVLEHRASIWARGFRYGEELAWLAVPMFFVLSGYLIGGILFRTRNRQGFFKVFYGRRAVRVLPVYYLAIIAVAVSDLAHGVHLDYKFWSHFIYIQNFMPGYANVSAAPNNQVIHLWSLAVEEQFYLTWPLIVWFAKDRKTLLKIVVAICALCWMVRLISPWIHLSPERSYFATPTRIDTILFGVALALVADHHIYRRFQPLAKYAAAVGIVLWLVSCRTHWNQDFIYYRLTVEYALANFTLFALIAAALEEGSAFARFLSVRWVCWLGKMSYGLYVFHLLYRPWFINSLRPMLLKRVSDPGASIVTVTSALALTVALGMLSQRFIEKPALSLKRHFSYGPELAAPSSVPPARIGIPESTPAKEVFSNGPNFLEANNQSSL